MHCLIRFLLSTEDLKEMPDSIVDDRMAVPIKLNLPTNLSKDEEVAIADALNKWCHNRFQVQSGANSVIRPYSMVDLLRIDNRSSLTHKCLNMIQKRWKIDDIEEKRIGKSENVDLFIVDNENLDKGFVCCVLVKDIDEFMAKMLQISNYGKTLANIEPYQPEKFEMCIALQFDDDGTEVWYRAQFQQNLQDGRAQVGLIDFGVSSIVQTVNIRKFEDQFGFGCLNFMCKIRCENNSLDLLDQSQFQNFNTITALRVEPVGKAFELHFDQNYFFEDDNFEEEILQAED